MVEALRRQNSSVIEFNPRSEAEKERNILITNALGMFLAIDKKNIVSEHYVSVMYRDPDNVLHEIPISVGDNTPDGFNGEIPEGFSLPAHVIGDGYYGELNVSAKRPKIIPHHVLGSDGKEYFLKKIYFFNKVGQAFKCEFPHEAMGVLTEKTKELLPRIDFVPSEVDAQYARLNIEDYADIQEMLIKIKDCKVQAT